MPASRSRELRSGCRPTDGLLVAVDLQELLTDQGIPAEARRAIGGAQKDPEDVAKVLLNALYLQSQGKLQNGPGYIRAGIEDGYDLLPQVANRLETSSTRTRDRAADHLELKREKARQEAGPRGGERRDWPGDREPPTRRGRGPGPSGRRARSPSRSSDATPP